MTVKSDGWVTILGVLLLTIQLLSQSDWRDITSPNTQKGSNDNFEKKTGRHWEVWKGIGKVTKIGKLRVDQYDIVF